MEPRKGSSASKEAPRRKQHTRGYHPITSIKQLRVTRKPFSLWQKGLEFFWAAKVKLYLVNKVYRIICGSTVVSEIR